MTARVVLHIRGRAAHVMQDPEAPETKALVVLRMVGREGLVTTVRAALRMMAPAGLHIPARAVRAMRDPAVRVTQGQADQARHVQ